MSLSLSRLKQRVCAAPSLNDDEFDINAINTFWPGDAATFAVHAIRLLVNCIAYHPRADVS